jgi:hypothetical protein
MTAHLANNEAEAARLDSLDATSEQDLLECLAAFEHLDPQKVGYVLTGLVPTLTVWR